MENSRECISWIEKGVKEVVYVAWREWRFIKIKEEFMCFMKWISILYLCLFIIKEDLKVLRYFNSFKKFKIVLYTIFSKL